MNWPQLAVPYDRNTQAQRRAVNHRILRVDLTERRLWVDEHDEAWYRRYVGGRGVVAYYLMSALRPGADPLGPENLLIFAPGVLNGTTLPGSGRHGVGGKSPLTGGLGSSEAGGWWGAELKRAGFDGVVIQGRAETPVYLWIHDGQVESRPADHLWGQLTGDVQTAIRAELGDERACVSSIGPAGENLVRYAAIMTHANRAAGRTGMGAVMGSKNLKAIAVRATAPALGVADRRGLAEVSKWLGANYKTLAGWAVDTGTPGGVNWLNMVSGLPTRAFQDPDFEGANDISGERMHATILQERDTCNVCPITCKQVVRIDEGPYRVDPIYGGPEYETLAAFGSNCGISDLAAVAKANELAAAYGLDTISTGGTLAFVMECFASGQLTPAQTSGWDLHFGDAAGMVQAIEMIGRGTGFGVEMGQGSARLAQMLGGGAPDIALHVRGQELPMHEPRLKPGLGLGYMVSPTGADHMHNIHDTAYMSRTNDLARVAAVGITEPVPQHDLGKRKVDLFFHETNWTHFLDCAVVCMFYPYHYHHLADALGAAAGWDVSVDEIMTIGRRAATLSRMFNLREGLDPASEKLPKRFFNQFTRGGLAEERLDPVVLEHAKAAYFARMGWAPDTGRPTPESLAELELDWTAEAAAR
jgi:aldehyde:ferredoxin oxidoreductase